MLFLSPRPPQRCPPSTVPLSHPQDSRCSKARQLSVRHTFPMLPFPTMSGMEPWAAAAAQKRLHPGTAGVASFSWRSRFCQGGGTCPFLRPLDGCPPPPSGWQSNSWLPQHRASCPGILGPCPYFPMPPAPCAPVTSAPANPGPAAQGLLSLPRFFPLSLSILLGFLFVNHKCFQARSCQRVQAVL